jgi:hypothetical protein
MHIVVHSAVGAMKHTPILTILLILGAALGLHAQTSSILIKSGDTINGTSSNSAILRSFGNVSMNDAGDIAFQGYASESLRITNTAPVTNTVIARTTNTVPVTNTVITRTTNTVPVTNTVVRANTNSVPITYTTNVITTNQIRVTYATNVVTSNQTRITSTTNVIIGSINKIATSSTNYAGIWRSDSNGNLNLTFRSGLPSQSSNPLISGFTDPVLNNNGATAFIGFNYVTNGFSTNTLISTNITTGSLVTNTVTNPIVAPTNSTIYLALPDSGPNNLLNVASVGSPAPGTSDNFTSFNNLALPDVGGVIFVGMAGTNQGVWVQNADASVHLVAIRGQSMTVGNTNRIVKSFSLMNGPYPGVTRSYSEETGVITYQAWFTDGTSAAVRVNR